ncbi:hypothetical protein E2986_07793 [Frieseomelitta varia]|uniref:Uncharacterized protein n=1 Tax=Frieseomelitta varia TaxID=561572 RepID=A0A833W5R2_9HYME|nr:hypothetical protein E2986_07793 [Frieseomelitta varia]
MKDFFQNDVGDIMTEDVLHTDIQKKFLRKMIKLYNTELTSNDVTSVVTYVILFISFTFNIFIYCYIGEIVAEECRKIGEISYMIEWYRLSGNKKLCCILIIAMSNCSVQLTAGNIVKLSISTFSEKQLKC